MHQPFFVTPRLKHRFIRLETSPEIGKNSPESDSGNMNFTETELTLGLPGDHARGTKRGFSNTVDHDDQSDVLTSTSSKPSTKTQVVGWPPVKETRRRAATKRCKYVKVAVDGAPYLRKVDLEMYGSYQQLFGALEELSSGLTIRNYMNEMKPEDQVNGVEYVPTYEDGDGDWMLVGDVPWRMFVESSKRVRLMKSSEAVGLAPRTPSISCTSTS